MTIPAYADRVRHHLRRPLARTPYAWDAAMQARPGKRATLARPDTAIVIEGFLRSGNTFSVAAFTVANGRSLHVGRHLHAAAHVRRAVRLGLPTVVLVRQPQEAVLSYLVRRPTLRASDAVLEYLDFYRGAWPARAGFVVAPFTEVVSDFGATIAAVNARFGTSFQPYRATPDHQAAAFAIVEEMNRRECDGRVVESHVGRPSGERDRRKEELRAQLARPRAAARLRDAERLFDRYLALADVQRAGTSARPDPAPQEAR